MIILVWIIQLIIMASFDTRKSIMNKLLSWSAYLISLAMTLVWAGSSFLLESWVNIFWLIIPFIVIPILAGLTGGIVKGLYLKHKDNKHQRN